MDIKSNLQLLSEAAAIDTKINTKAAMRYDVVREAYKAIPEATEAMVTEASDVIVTATSDGNYYVEMVNLAPFMLDSGIKSVATALDKVAESYGLPDRSVGLVVESQSFVDYTLESARAKAESTGNTKILENALSKVNKNNAIIAKLMSEGYEVVKKTDNAKVCPDCGKAKCKCDCDDNCKKVEEIMITAQEAAILEAKLLKTKGDIVSALDQIERKQDAGDHILSFFFNWFKRIIPNLAGAVVKGAAYGSAAHKAIAAGAGAADAALVGGAASATVALPAAIVSTLAFVACACCTRIFRVAGSISDKKVKCEKILKSIDKSIAAIEKKGGDEKQLARLKSAREKVNTKIKELEKKYAGKSKLYQNMHTESVSIDTVFDTVFDD